MHRHLAILIILLGGWLHGTLATAAANPEPATADSQNPAAMPAPTTASQVSDSTSASGPGLTPYRAVYQGTYNGRSFGTEGHAELIALGEQRYRARIQVNNMLFDILEESTFSWDNGHYRPHHYQSKRDTLFTKRHKSVQFDWSKQQVNWRYKKDKGSYPLPVNALDAMTTELAIAQALRQSHAPRTLQFIEADRKRSKPRNFQVEAEETLETPIGTLLTVRVQQVRDSEDDRATTLWYSPRHNYLLVRAQHRDDGDLFELNINEYTALDTGSSQP